MNWINSVKRDIATNVSGAPIQNDINRQYTNGGLWIWAGGEAQETVKVYWQNLMGQKSISISARCFMRRMLFGAMLCVCGFAFASTDGQPEKYPPLVMPKNVAFGMTREALQAVRPDVMQIDEVVGSRNTNAIVLTELNEESSLAILYHFIDDRLRAVTRGQLHFGHRDEQMVKLLHDVLTRDLVKKSDEKVLRLNEQMQRVQVNAELWTDEKSGVCVYFMDTSNEIVVITFDPKYFGKKDFFFCPDEMSKNESALENAPKTVEVAKQQE
ncbi:MAG: hypothetical protein L6455_07950 [Kiritimatiellae bacterium]|nr:hypothetical protein [Kiritimatiellia bacterium]